MKKIKYNNKIDEINNNNKINNNTNMININNKIRNKKFILDGNKFKKNASEQNKKKIDKENINKSKNLTEKKILTFEAEKKKTKKKKVILLNQK